MRYTYKFLKLTLPYLSTLIGVILGAYLTYHYAFNVQLKLDKINDRRRIYSEVFGQKLYVQQMYVSFFNAVLNSDYHERKWFLTGNKDNSIDYKEAQRWMEISEELINKISLNNKEFYKTIGELKAVFPQSPMLDSLIFNIKFHVPKRQLPPDTLNLSELENWKDNTIVGFQEIAKQAYGDPIDELINYLDQYVCEQ